MTETKNQKGKCREFLQLASGLRIRSIISINEPFSPSCLDLISIVSDGLSKSCNTLFINHSLFLIIFSRLDKRNIKSFNYPFTHSSDVVISLLSYYFTLFQIFTLTLVCLVLISWHLNCSLIFFPFFTTSYSRIMYTKIMLSYSRE